MAALLVQLATSIFTQGLPVLVPFVRADLRLTLAQAGIFASIPALGSFLALAGIGWAVDRFGDRTVLILGALGTGVLTLVSALAPGYAILLLLLVLVGVGSATPTPAGTSAVMHEFTRQGRGTAMSIRQTGVPLGGALAAITLAPLAAAAGWRLALALCGAAVVLSGLACAVLYRQDRRPAEVSGPTPVERGAAIRDLLTRDLVLTSGFGMAMVASQFCLVTYLVLYLNHRWLVPVVVGSGVLAVTQLAGGAGRIGWGWISDRFFAGARQPVLVIVSVVAALSGLALAWLPAGVPLPLITAVVMLYGAGTVGWSGLYFTLLAELARPGFQGRSVGLGMTLNQPGIVLGPWLFGLLVDISGSYRVAWTLLAGCLVLGGLSISRVRERRRGAG